jgi:hypothetical protein
MSDNLDPNVSTPEPGFHSSDLLFPMPSKEDIKKNGIFYYVLSEQERVFYAMVRNSEGLKDVMELVEAKILYIMCVYPANIGLLLRAIHTLERLQKTQRLVFKEDDTTKLETALEKVFTRMKIPIELMRDGFKQSPAAA